MTQTVLTTLPEVMRCLMMLPGVLKLILVALLLQFGLSVPAAQGQTRTSSPSPQPASVELEGRLIIQTKYGPPNFGENPKTDKRVKVPIVVLTKHINVRGTPGAAHNAVSVEGARRIQLLFTDPSMDYKALVGKHIKVKGSLFHAETGGHYTDVVMSVQSIEPKKRRGAPGTEPPYVN